MKVKRSAGWHSSALQSAASVSKRTPFTLPDFNSERLASVMPTRAARSFERIFRLASMTSRVTVMGMGLNYLRVFFGQLDSFGHDPGYNDDDGAYDCNADIVARHADC
jgi:hypothetical protein